MQEISIISRKRFDPQISGQVGCYVITTLWEQHMVVYVNVYGMNRKLTMSNQEQKIAFIFASGVICTVFELDSFHPPLQNNKFYIMFALSN